MVAAELLPGLVERGQRVTALAPLAPDAQIEMLAALAERVPTARFPVPHDQTDCSRPLSEAYRQQQMVQIHGHLTRMIAEERPDLILVGRESFVVGVPDLAARHGLPCAIICHGAALYYLSSYFPDPPRSQLLADLSKADRLLCCARHLAETMADAGFSRTVTIPNGVDCERYRQHKKDARLCWDLGIDKHATVAIHVSNLKPAKRLGDLFEAAAMIRERAPQLRYLMVGDGPDRSAAEAALRSSGAGDRFRFAGWIEPAGMPALLNLADLAIMPSGSEAMSLACLEAMACGRAVIASDIPGMREIIADGETGLLFRAGDVEDLAAKILLAAGDQEVRKGIGRAASAYVERHHRAEDMVRRYEAALMDLL
jgi:glycosyltransferase involved in cell wall biosynthesis